MTTPVPNPAVSDKERTWAMLAHLCYLLMFATGALGIIGPVLLMAMPEKIIGEDSEFVKRQAKQALFWCVGGLIMAIVTCGIGTLIMAIWSVLAALEANKGVNYTYPFLDNV